MTNPFLKKNPFMSMWLSGANAMAGSVRGRATAQAKRQATTATAQAIQDIFDLWAAQLTPAQEAQGRTQAIEATST